MGVFRVNDGGLTVETPSWKPFAGWPVIVLYAASLGLDLKPTRMDAVRSGFGEKWIVGPLGFDEESF
ncbi:hypothetical protein N7527_004974 [Penicillium freii]|nr:hypothetical protein N7527_004974 [Penicillium freii]